MQQAAAKNKIQERVPYIWIAGVLQLQVASANVVTAKMFRYREHLQELPGHIAEVFVVQNVFIMFMVFGMAGLFFQFSDDLSGRSEPGRCLSGFLSLFWCIRLVFQLFIYDRQVRQQYRLLDALFLFTFGYLTVVFATGTLTWSQ